MLVVEKGEVCDLNALIALGCRPEENFAEEITVEELKELKKPPLNKNRLAMMAREQKEKKEAVEKIFDQQAQSKYTKEELLTLEVIQLLADKKRSDASERIVQHILEKESMYTIRNDQNFEIWMYREGIYIANGKSYIKEFCREIFGSTYTHMLLSDVLTKIEADTFIDEDEFFLNDNPYEIPVKNGILNLKTKELTPHTPEKFFFSKVNSNYEPEASCEHIIKFFEDILVEDDLKVMQELFGFILLGEYRYEKAFMFVGGGRNGKGKTIDLIRRFVGEKYCSALPLKTLCKENSFDIEQLFRKKVNVGGDIEGHQLQGTATFKALTGRDQITVPRKFKSALTFINAAKLIFAANEIPASPDSSDAFYNRWVVVEFKNRYLEKKDYYLAKKDFEEGKLSEKKWKHTFLRDADIIQRISTDDQLDGLLNWALEGFDRLCENGEFSTNGTTSSVKEFWIRSADSFTAFCMDHIEECFDNQILKSDLAAAYSSYCKELELKPRTARWIKKILEGNFGATQQYPTVQDDDGLPVRKLVWNGIKFKTAKYQQKL
jgi:putative DNA primase/helicase